jgi:lipopolysaccharide export LptBFGC system permease protein LptF
MNDLFDILTVACFLLTVLAFFLWTDRNHRILLHLLISAMAFAVANELGRTGSPILAAILIGAGAVYAWLIIANQRREGGSKG